MSRTGVRIYLILGTAVIPTVFAVYFWLRLRNVYGAGLKILRETVVELDVKDPYFNGHIKNVENLSILVASEMKFSKRKKDELKHQSKDCEKCIYFNSCQ